MPITKEEAMKIVDKEYIKEWMGIEEDNVHVFHKTYNHQSKVAGMLLSENFIKPIKNYISKILSDICR